MKKINNKTIKQMIDNRSAYVLLLPFFILFALFIVWPLLLTFALSLTSYNVFELPVFIGWQNYVNLFVNDEVFAISVRNTLMFSLIVGPLGFFLSLFFAWIINEMPSGVREVATLIFYAPSISGTAFAIWLLIFDGDIYGYLNSFLIRFNAITEPVAWLQTPKYMPAAVIIVQLWLSMGTAFLAMRAGFTTVDRQLYESGMVDGVRNRWQELWYITLPAMKPHLILSSILSITAAFSIEVVPTALTGFPSVDYATQTMMQTVRDYGLVRMERGYACAMATLVFLLTLGANKFARKIIDKVGR